MKKIFRALITLLVTTGVLLTNAGNITAQSNALSITPRKDYTLKPGESVNDTLTITNRNSEEPLQLQLRIVDFRAQDESGTPELLRDQNAAKTSWSLRDYIELPEQVVVEPGGTVRVPMVIRMADNVGAGSYYSGIEYSSVSDQQEDRLNISASGITLAFVTVPGQARQQLSFLQFGAFIPEKTGTEGSFAGLFFGERPKVLAYRLKNEGNVAEQPNASIQVKNASGDVVYSIADANPRDQLALIGQTRRFDACINPEVVEQTTDDGTNFDAVICGDTNFSPGRYTAELSVVYGQNGNETREITAKTSFWYLPWWFIGIIVAGLGVVTGVGFYLTARVRNYRGRKTRRR